MPAPIDGELIGVNCVSLRIDFADVITGVGDYIHLMCPTSRVHYGVRVVVFLNTPAFIELYTISKKD